MFNNLMNQKIEHNDNKIEKLSLQIESLDKMVDEFVKQLNISLDSIAAYTENKENFSETAWTKLNEEKKKVEEKLETELANIVDPLRAKRARSSLNVRQTWIHVK